MGLYALVWQELRHRKSQMISGLLAISLGIGVIVGIRSITMVSEKAVAVNLDNLGAKSWSYPRAPVLIIIMLLILILRIP